MRRPFRSLLVVLLAGLALASCRQWGRGSDTAEVGERFLYVCDQRLPGVISFRLDEVTGTVSLAATSVLDLGSTPERLTIAPSGRVAYGLPGRGVLAYALAHDGGVTVLTQAKARLRASNVQLAPGGRHLYILDPDKGVAAFEIGADGAFTPVGAPMKVGKAPIDIAIDPSGRALYVLARPEEYGAPPEVLVLGVDPASGALTPSTAPPLRVGHAASLVRVHPSGRFGCVVEDTFDGKVDMYEIDAASGVVLRRVAGSPFGSGARPLKAEFHPSGRFLYVLASSAVWAYAVDAGGGLSLLPGSPFETGELAWHLGLDPDGRFLYTATPSSPGGRLGVWGIDPERGTLVPVAGSPFLCGKGPVFVARRPGAAVEVASLPQTPVVEAARSSATPGPESAFGLAEASVTQLADKLQDPDWRVRYHAAVYLSAQGPAAALAVARLSAALGDANEPVVQRAAFALETIGPQAAPAVPALIELLRSDRASFRQAAASALGRIGSVEARDALAQAMQRPDFGEGAQSEAAMALRAVGATAEQVPALLGVIVAGDNKTRESATEMLGRLGPAAEPAVPDLILLLDHDKADVRKAAANVLGWLGPRAGASIPILYGNLQDEASSVREAASRAIQSIRRRPIG